MRKVWVIARHEFLVNLRRPGYILVTLAVPAVGALVMGAAYFFGGEAATLMERTLTPPQSFGLVDESGLFEPVDASWADRFRVFATEADGRRAVEDEDVDVLMVVPPDYLAQGSVRVLSNGGGFTAAMIQESTMVRAFFIDHLLDGDEDALLRDRLVRPVIPVFVDLAEAQGAPAVGPDGGVRTAMNIIVPYALSIMLIITVFMSSNYLLRSVSEEKASRVIEILISSVTPRQLLAGKVIGLGALGLTQVLVWLASSVVMSGGMLALFSVAIPALVRPDVIVLAVVY
jgi:ABC-2 type transport system permease protein